MLKPVFGTAPVVGFESTIDDLRTDLEVYDLFYRANANGATMSPEQLARFDELRKIFE